MHVCTLTVFLILFVVTPISAQYWERFIGTSDTWDFVHDMCEYYDKGYLLGTDHCDDFTPQGNYTLSVIIYKLDINGEILWWRNIRTGGKLNMRACKSLPDGRFIIGTQAWRNGGWVDRILCLDACGNEQWCTQFEDPTGEGYLLFDLEIIGNKIVFVKERFGFEEPKFSIVMLDLDGNKLCEKPFLLQENHPLMDNPWVHKLLPLPNDEFMALGCVYHPDKPGGINWLRAMFVKFDAEGNEQWMLPFGLNDNIISYKTNCENVIIPESGRYFAFAYNYDYPMKMILMKFNDEGIELGHTISEMDSLYGYGESYFAGAQKISKNKYLAISAWFNDGENGKRWEVIVDSSINMYQDSLRLNANDLLGYTLFQSHDNKFLYSGVEFLPHDYQGYFNKVSLDPLSFDTMYTASYTYDSLCPGIAYADTLYFEDCMQLVGENEIQNIPPYELSLHLYPNPTREELTISLSEITHTDPVIITIHTLTGETKWQGTLVSGEQTKRLSVYSWPQGIYIVTAKKDKEVVGREKVVVM